MAFGVSQSPVMSNTSNVECVQTSPGTITPYTSWTSAARIVSRAGVDQSSIELVSSRFIDGRIHCKIRRDSVTLVHDHEIDLENDEHYLLLAGGIFITDFSVGPHDVNRGATSERIALRNPAEPTETPPTAPPGDDSIYAGCDDEKLCFGMPDGCVASRNCQLLVTSRRLNGEFFEFEMLSNRKIFIMELMKKS